MNGEPRITSDPPTIVPVEDVVGVDRVDEIQDFLHGVIRSYRRTLSGNRRKLEGVEKSWSPDSGGQQSGFPQSGPSRGALPFACYERQGKPA